MQSQRLNFLIYLAIFAIVSLICLVFYSGLMNADSVVQYKQALSGSFDDW